MGFFDVRRFFLVRNDVARVRNTDGHTQKSNRQRLAILKHEWRHYRNVFRLGGGGGGNFIRHILERRKYGCASTGDAHRSKSSTAYPSIDRTDLWCRPHRVSGLRGVCVSRAYSTIEPCHARGGAFRPQILNEVQ